MISTRCHAEVLSMQREVWNGCFSQGRALTLLQWDSPGPPYSYLPKADSNVAGFGQGDLQPLMDQAMFCVQIICNTNSESIFLIQSLATVTMPSSTCDLRSFYTISLLNAIFNVCDLICGCVWPLQPGPVARGSLTDKNRGLATASDLEGSIFRQASRSRWHQQCVGPGPSDSGQGLPDDVQCISQEPVHQLDRAIGLGCHAQALHHNTEAAPVVLWKAHAFSLPP